MKVSTKTRYGYRFMINLGLNHEKRLVQLKEVAEKEKISEKYLSVFSQVLKI